MAGYIGSLPGILKLVTALVGVIIFGLALASWPREYVRESAKLENSEIDLWKFYIFFGFSIVALLFSVVTVLVFVFAGKSADGLKMGDAIGSIVIGILLLIGAALLLQEIVEQYKDLKEFLGCDSDSPNIPSIPNLPFSKASAPAGTKSLEDDIEAVMKCVEKHGLNNVKDLCNCGVKTITKYSVNIAAGAFGVINSILLMAAGGVAFAKK